jgi:hypothetical protein
MIFVCWHCCHYHTAPDNQGTENVRKRFNSISHQGMRFAKNTGCHLATGKKQINDYSKKRRP